MPLEDSLTAVRCTTTENAGSNYFTEVESMNIPIQGDIKVSNCVWGVRGGRNKEYRYVLSRVWSAQKDRLVFIGLNPSTADEKFDDPTVRRCVNFAKTLGYGSMTMLNIFALRSTDPKKLQIHQCPVGPLNDEFIMSETLLCDTIVAWGNHGRLFDRGDEVIRMLESAGRKMLCLGQNVDGSPKHPLYLKKDLPLVKFKLRST